LQSAKKWEQRGIFVMQARADVRNVRYVPLKRAADFKGGWGTILDHKNSKGYFDLSIFTELN